MSDVEPTATDNKVGEVSTSPAPTTHARPGRSFGHAGTGSRFSGRAGGHGGARGGARRSGGDRERVRPEYDQKMLNIRRVARVVAGGRRFSFSVLIAIGNRKGMVGVGLGKAGDTALAIEKATKDAKKHMITIKRTSNNSITQQIEAKYSSALIVLRPAPRKGLIAGSAVRSVLELAGVTDVNAKILSGSKNKLNIAQAAIKALSTLKVVKVKDEGSVSKS
ncbi:MAG: 30S ribosomal protein S5 [Candidatus Taylorbacteria bacterium CG11_big_fil_rev_8_21_14_0_20_46_11]|uniref:Small ribosomal subunit protein uS5 n=1 Tax=Candidatus Taylorbacteria bacterium CG11_big_fil_rev_8_21_14_0_20_46_11 TaxID=1975025 RepID=A0A2H0KD25_9BACT|nr:MAG: 30S ribosomal protein S5 [Candidatus Taylorbacteria bacterium CG11_big_fil_rev_8_21_14_0_20_46_11]